MKGARKPLTIAVKKPSTHIKVPKADLISKPKKTPRIYSKETTNADPSAYSNWSFGDTGMTGES
jgi:hypothetical protein